MSRVYSSACFVISRGPFEATETLTIKAARISGALLWPVDVSRSLSDLMYCRGVKSKIKSKIAPHLLLPSVPTQAVGFNEIFECLGCPTIRNKTKSVQYLMPYQTKFVDASGGPLSLILVLFRLDISKVLGILKKSTFKGDSGEKESSRPFVPNK